MSHTDKDLHVKINHFREEHAALLRRYGVDLSILSARILAEDGAQVHFDLGDSDEVREKLVDLAWEIRAMAK